MTLKDQVWESKYKYKNEKSFSDTADRLKLAVNNKHNQLNNNLSTAIGLSLNIPIFNSLRARNELKKAKINHNSNNKIIKRALPASSSETHRHN